MGLCPIPQSLSIDKLRRNTDATTAIIDNAIRAGYDGCAFAVRDTKGHCKTVPTAAPKASVGPINSIGIAGSIKIAITINASKSSACGIANRYSPLHVVST